MKVLIVDDDIPTTQVIEQSIDWKLLGVTEVSIAYNANSAKAALDEKRPDLVLSDIEMPKGSGLDVLLYAREKNYNTQFIILTCHADFDYASEALRHGAVDYLVKPFDTEKMQAAVAKTVEKIAYQKEQENISLYKEQWIDNHNRRETDFWRDLLFARMHVEPESIQNELKNRQVNIDLAVEYSVLLLCARQLDVLQNGWTEILFSYALHNLAAEIIEGTTECPRVHHYSRNERCYALLVIPNHSHQQMEGRITQLISVAKTYLQCEITAYLKDGQTLRELSDTRTMLEGVDKKNVCVWGVLLANSELENSNTSIMPQIDLQKIERLLKEERGIEAINLLHTEIERFIAAAQLDYEALHKIHEDYIQIVYSILYNNNIQAHELFSDETSQKLFAISETSVFDMMKWASGITEKMIAYQKEMRKTKTVIDTIKQFIAENYGNDISRNEIAASVYLSPDYAAKLFKADTGIYLNEYINDIRIQKAKELLIDDANTISEVASMVGMDNFSYFSTLFKKSTGMSPRKYKQSGKILQHENLAQS